jgi:hypothetical protein
MSMRRLNRCAALLLAVAAGCAGVTSARADTVTGSTLSPLPADQLGIKLNGIQGIPNGSETVYAGAINWSRSSSTGTVGGFETYNSAGAGTVGTATFTSFCIDIVQDVYVPGGPYTYNVVDPTAAPIESPGSYNLITSAEKYQLQALWGDYISTAMKTADGQAAFQIAIWDIVFGTNKTSVTDTSSAFSVYNASSNVTSLANTWLTQSLTDSTNPATFANLLALTSTSAQDQLVSTGGGLGSPPSVSVPLPMAAQGGIALLGLTAVRQLRSRSRKA